MTMPIAGTAHIEVEDLRIAYGSVLAVKGVSFSVQAGEQLTLLGSDVFLSVDPRRCVLLEDEGVSEIVTLAMATNV